MRAAHIVAPPLLVVVSALAGCHGRTCDLDRRSTNAVVALTSPLADYDATVQTTSDWFEPVRPLDPGTGAELDGIALNPVTRDPALITVRCRDGLVVLEEEEGGRDGQDERPAHPCADGFAFAGGFGPAEGAVPAEAQAGITLPGSDIAFFAPAEGFTRLTYEPHGGSERCPVKGFLATLVIVTDE